jgi:hypothetical protein
VVVGDQTLPAIALQAAAAFKGYLSAQGKGEFKQAAEYLQALSDDLERLVEQGLIEDDRR